MKQYYFIFLLTLFLNPESLAQSTPRHTLFLSNGYTFNPALQLNGDAVEESRGYVVTAGLMYRMFSYKKIHTEIGLAAKSIFSSGTVNDESYYTSALRLAMPLKFTVALSDQWEVSSGFSFQNNVEIRKVDFRLRDKYSWRVDFLTEARYLLNERWFLTLGCRF